MEEILNQVLFENTLRSYLISLAIIGGVTLFRRLLSKGTAWLIAKLITSKNRPFNRKMFQDLVLAPIDLFLVVLAIIVAFDRLKMPEALQFTVYKTNFHDILEAIARGVLIGSFIWLCNRIIMYIAHLLALQASKTEDRSDDQLVIFFRDFLKVLVWIIGVLLILKFSFGFDLGNVLTGLSIVGAALALAFRESLENLIASFVIFFDKPFTIGDMVKVESVNGTVEKIGLRSTRIRTTEKTFVTVPNKKMVDSILDNQTLRTQRNVISNIQVSLAASPLQLQSCIKALEALVQREEILDFNIYLADTGTTAHIIHMEYFVTMEIPVKAFFKLRETINLQVIKVLRDNQVELAAERKEVYVQQAR